MAGRKKFSELIAKTPPERQVRINQMTQKLNEEMDLAQFRTAQKLSPAALGEI